MIYLLVEMLRYYMILWNHYNKLKCDFKSAFDSNMKQWKKDAEQFQNIHKGKRCFIVGNGPSLKKQNLIFLKNETCFLCNYMALTDYYDSISPEYYMLSDPGFFSTEDGVKVIQRIAQHSRKPEIFVPYEYAASWRDKNFDSTMKNHIH